MPLTAATPRFPDAPGIPLAITLAAIGFAAIASETAWAALMMMSGVTLSGA
jgi:hypothetical protein